MPSCERYYPRQEQATQPVVVLDNEHDPASLEHKLKACKDIASAHFGIDEQYADWHDGWSGEHFLALLDLTCLSQHFYYNRPGYKHLRDEMSSLKPSDWSEILRQTEAQSLVNFMQLKEDSYDRHLSPLKPEATALFQYVEDMDKQQATEELDWLRSRIIGCYSHYLTPDDLLLARKNGRDFTRAEFLGRAIHTWFDSNGREHVDYDVSPQELDQAYEMGGDQTILVLLRSKYFDCQPRKMTEALGRIVGDQALEEALSIVSRKQPYKIMKQHEN